MEKDFIKNLSEKPVFWQNGLAGFGYQLNNRKVEIYLEVSETGHDEAVSSDEIAHIYYVLEGSGDFVINNEQYPVKVGQLVEIPPKNRFTFKGKMKLLLIMEPPFSSDKINIIK